MTRKTLLQILQRGNIIPDSVDIDDEEAALDAQHRETQDAQAASAARAHALLGATVNATMAANGGNGGNGESANGAPRMPAATPKKGVKGKQPPIRKRSKTAITEPV